MPASCERSLNLLSDSIYLQTTTTSGDTADDAYVADLLGVADEKIHRLQLDVSKTREDRDATDRRNKSLQKQV